MKIKKNAFTTLVLSNSFASQNSAVRNRKFKKRLPPFTLTAVKFKLF
jgi:hypothetical protein